MGHYMYRWDGERVSAVLQVAAVQRRHKPQT
jgi:hypothetical protein